MSQAAYELQVEMLANYPRLRSLARSLCGSIDYGDDLVQETFAKAWANADSFTPGTNARAWMCTILRNHFGDRLRRRKREVEDPTGAFAATLTSAPEQESVLRLAEIRAALAGLPGEQTKILVLVADGFSYVDLAEMYGVALGTIKSRVRRARSALAEKLGLEKNEIARQGQRTNYLNLA